MALSLLSFGKDQEYYTPARAIVDGIIGFAAGWMLFGFGLWWGLALAAGALALCMAGVTMRFGRRWLGIGILAGAACTSLWFVYATKALGL